MLEFVSVLRRLVSGDTKTAPTANDRILVIDAADNDKLKEARVGDLPATTIDRRMFTVLQDGIPPSGFYAYRLAANAINVTLPLSAVEALIINHRPEVSFIYPGEGRELVDLADDPPNPFFAISPHTAVLFSLLTNDQTWIVIPLT